MWIRASSPLLLVTLILSIYFHIKNQSSLRQNNVLSHAEQPIHDWNKTKKRAPVSDLEIVVSMYNEGIQNTAHAINTLTSHAIFTPYLERQNGLAITIYHKGPNNHTVKELSPLANLWLVPKENVALIHLKNIGREGGSYLDHIINRSVKK